MYSTVHRTRKPPGKQCTVEAVSIRKLLYRGLKCYARKILSGKEEININI